MRGFLRNPRHLYMLDTDVVSIGRKKFKELESPYKYRKAEFHIPLVTSNADPFHALIEKNHVRNCYILMDLNTTYGTYVNDIKLQNQAIKLLPGDIIRFGHDESTYEFGILNEYEGRQSLKSFVRKGKVPVETGTLEDLQLKRWSSSRISNESFASNSSFTSRPDSTPISRTLSASNTNTPIHVLLKRRIRSVPIKLRPGGNRRTFLKSRGIPITQSAMEPMSTPVWSCPEEPVRTSTVKKVNFKEDEASDEPW